MSHENSQLEDSGEVTFHPHRNLENHSFSERESGCPLESSPKQVSVSHEPENMDKLLLNAIHDLRKEFQCMNHNVGEQLQDMKQEIEILKHGNVPPTRSNSPLRLPNINHNSAFSLGAGENHTFIPSIVRPTNANNPQSTSAAKPTIMGIKPSSFDGGDDFDEYLTQFKILAKLHNWDYQVKSLCLASCLSGNARAILTELNEAEQQDFDSLVRVLSMRYGSIERAEMYRARLKGRIRGGNESLPELAQSIKKLTRRAYPTADQAVINTLALDHFVDALTDPDMRLRLREARPRDIEEAEVLAIRFETYKIADAQRGYKIHNIQTDSTQSLLMDIRQTLREDLQSLTREIKNLTKPQYNQHQQHNYNKNQNPTNTGYKTNSKWGNSNQNYKQKNSQPPRSSNYQASGSGVGSRQ